MTNGVAYIASITVGDEMTTDATNNINVLLVWYWWGKHGGAQLADSIMVASYNSKLHTVSMISLPRDLIVLADDGSKVKINSILSRAYNTNGGDIRTSAQHLIKSVEKITWLQIPYYAMIDFDGFIEVVDSLGGIDVYVPSHFLDREYPVDWDGSYEIFELFEGWNYLSGPNTLKYARSRHSTSDFSRSKRQQQILEAIAKKMFSSDTLSVNKIGELYNFYTQIIKTNITLEQLIGLSKHGTNLPSLYTAGYTTQCTNTAWRTMTMWCVLRDATGGILPAQSTWWTIEAYDHMKLFAHFITTDPSYLSEEAKITVYNATDKELAKTLAYGDGIATKTAVKLRKYWLNVIAVTNSDSVSTGSFVEIYGTGSYDKTIEMIKNFVPVLDIKNYPDFINPQGVWTTGGIYLYLWDDYLNQVGNSEFDFYGML